MSGVLCKDCKHASWNPLKLYTWYCKREMVPEQIKEDPVTGPTVRKAYYQGCAMARIGSDGCGKDGKFWEPKHKKDLFKFIKHVGSV
jgi:hypothetical protein